MNVIEIKNLSFSYNNELEALKNITLSVPQGSYVSILGHNGSGKSTLARLIIGLLKKNSGEISVLGLPVNKENVHKIRHDTMLVFQNPDNQFIGATVEDDIAFGLENRCIKTEEMQPIIDHFVKEVGMEEYKQKEPSMLSGGQKQRVAIAGALALNPKIIIFDEATSMLDPKGKREISSLIHKMKENNPDLTVISITHEIEEAFLSDKVIVLNKGEIALEGTPEEVFKDEEKMRELKLSIPLVFDVKKKLKEAGINIKCNNEMNSLIEAICQLK